ncbi:hypothetical protein J4E90_001428 [Alternaria incomplexa]|uniref:uncharacterized protein n=1 Tax=Alternaria incomplexa TaxID=1187928 RepID=UPI00221E422C|nr:uncharacterized protein J4E90_001428 [Alternaria incomplexa]KAI4922992.1 hypothetical protein J4E90_001428 [Alternaria incomplexa]
MAFSDKDVLAARKLVSFGFLTQIAASIVQAIAFSTYIRRDKIPCQSSTTHQSSSQHYSAAYWIYLAFRIAASIFPCQVAYRLTSSLNKIENKNNATRSARVKATALWRSLPATLATSYLIYWSFVLLHGLSIVNILRGTNTIEQSWHSLISEWGQSANAIIAICAICHVAYAIWRLFTAESVDERAQTATPSGLPISQAYPQPTWKTWKPWVWIMQRWPFHLGLDYSDHLLVDESMVETVLKPPLIIDPIARKKLWQDLMDGFTYNDPDGIIDCLDQGAPLDEPNDDGDYPIHLAARHNNTDILVKTRFKFTKDSINHDSLLLKNLASETPLEIACNTGTLEAVRWIMERLPRTHADVEDAVRRAFKTAILGEKVGVLKVLQHLWPEWRALGIHPHFGQSSLLRFAINKRKAKSAYRLTDPRVVLERQPNAYRIFELGWKGDLDESSLETILDDRHDQLSMETLDRLTHDVIGSSTLDNDAKLELLLALNIDISIILQQSVKFAADRYFDPDRSGNMWESVLQEGHTFELKDLDSSLTFASTVNDETLLRSRIREALIHRGGRDWSEAVKALKTASTNDLERLINLETDAAMLQRMLNVRDHHHKSLLIYAMSYKPDKQSLECMELMLKHGSSVEDSDLDYARQRAFGRDGDITIFMLLVTYAKHEVAYDTLSMVCSQNDSPLRFYTLYQILLRCGADPTLMNENGKIPRNVFESMSDLIIELWADEPEYLHPYTPLEELGKRRMGRGVREDVSEIMSLLQRWEDYHNDPRIGKPSDRPDPDWEALCDHIDESKWALLIEKNPEGFKIVEEH